MIRLLVSSFGPFGAHTTNVSADAARRLWEEGVPGADLVTVELPVVRYDSARLLVDAFDRLRPDAVVMLGIADTRGRITPERVAINVDDFRIPDNAGNQPVDEPIVPGGPAAYLATLPIKRIVAALEAADVPAAVSDTAGTYICNHVSYALLHHVERTGAPCRAGFIHLPPSLPLSTIVRGVSLAVQTVVEDLDRATADLAGDV